jgi:hypothetical protein
VVRSGQPQVCRSNRSFSNEAYLFATIHVEFLHAKRPFRVLTFLCSCS